jgi:hypothetical protein
MATKAKALRAGPAAFGQEQLWGGGDSEHLAEQNRPFAIPGYGIPAILEHVHAG